MFRVHFETNSSKEPVKHFGPPCGTQMKLKSTSHESALISILIEHFCYNLVNKLTICNSLIIDCK